MVYPNMAKVQSILTSEYPPSPNTIMVMVRAHFKRINIAPAPMLS